MRELDSTETDVISGAGIRITEIGKGMRIMGTIQRFSGAASFAFGAGYAGGTVLSKGYEWATGDSIGGDIYDVTHS